MSTTTPFSLGRNHTTDERDAQYPLRTLMADTPALVKRTRPWSGGPLLNQGAVGQCVGATGREWLTSTPVAYKNPHPTMEESYFGAKQNDGGGDPTPDRGSDARGLMKFYQSINLVDSYYWTTSADETAEYVRTRGCVCLGTPWDYGMFTPDASGQVHPDGREAGGHEILIEWFYASTRLFLVRNHWFENGRPWGSVKAHPGYFTLSRDDLESLVRRGADMCAAAEHPL